MKVLERIDLVFRDEDTGDFITVSTKSFAKAIMYHNVPSLVRELQEEDHES